MYKVIYKKELTGDNIIENIDSVIIDVSDIDKIKYIDVTDKNDIDLLTLYVRCLKYYHNKLQLNDRFVINNNYKGNKKITKAILNCDWLINEDDIIYSLDELETKSDSFNEELDSLEESTALKDIHKSILINYYLTTLKQAKKRIGIDDPKKYIKK